MSLNIVHRRQLHNINVNYSRTSSSSLYTCQVNIIDTVSGKFAFPRLAMLVR